VQGGNTYKTAFVFVKQR